MNFRTNALNATASLCLASVLLLVSGTTGSQDGGQEPILLDPDANPHALISNAFSQSGYATQEAADLATRALKIVTGKDADDVEIAPKPEGTILLDPDVNVHALLAELFRESGWTAAEASVHATNVLAQMLGIEPDPTQPIQQPLGTECHAYPLRTIYCDGEQKKRTTKYVHSLCWEEIGACLVEVIECDVNDDLWLEHPLPCLDLDCAWIKAPDEPSWVPCDWVDLGCACFFEDGEVDCGDLGDSKRCHILHACAGCPECD